MSLLGAAAGAAAYFARDMGKKVSGGVSSIAAVGITGYLGARLISNTLSSIDIPSKIGDFISAVSDGFSESLTDGIKKVDVDRVIKEVVEKIKTSIKNFDLDGILKEIGDHQDEFRTFFKEHSTAWINDFSDLTRKSVTGNLPWVGLGSVVLTGTPLLLRYLYHWAIDRIGDPKLIQERKSFTMIARMQDAIVNTYSWLAKNVSLYLKTSLKTYGAVIGTSMVTQLTFTLFDKFGAFNQDSYLYNLFSKNVIEPFSNLNSDVFCLLNGGTLGSKPDIPKPDTSTSWFSWQKNPEPISPPPRGYVCYASSEQILSLNNLTALAGALAAGAVLYSNLKALYNYLFAPPSSEGKPIFSAQLQSRVDEITSALANLKKHKGFLPNVLLYGPGGTGKTMIAKYIARNSGTNYVMMSGGDLAQFIRKGKHVTQLNELIEWIKNQPEPTILFIDECEALCKNRSRVTRPEDLELINAFLNHTGEASKKLMLVMATNDRDIDPAVLSRCDYKLAVMPPEKPERIKILNKYAKLFFSSWEIKTFLGEQKIDAISDLTEGLTGRALFKMLNAINNKKKSTRSNKLTETIIDDTVKNFIEQEKELEAFASSSSQSPFADTLKEPEKNENLLKGQKKTCLAS